MKIRIDQALLKSLVLMAGVIEARDPYTGGHLWRVSQYAHLLSQASGFSGDIAFQARLGGFLHDIGKISIPDGVLGKQGELTDKEYAVVKTHPGIGAMLIQEHPLAELVIDAVHQHHEWVNGSGYPDRLHSHQISAIARMVCISDAFDALTSTRPYRRQVSTSAAMAALKLEHGTQFDAELLVTFNGLANSGDLDSIVGHSAPEVPLVNCPSCGPVIVVGRETQDGDLSYCRVCGSQHRLHRRGGTFEVAPTGEVSTADQLKPKPEWGTIQAFIDHAPTFIKQLPV